MDINRFIELLEAYLQNKADEEEQQELFLMIASGKYDAQIQSRIDACFGEEVLTIIDPAKAKEILEYIITKPGALVERPQAEDRVIPMYRRKIFKYIAAACIILLVGIATYTLISKRSEKSPAVAVTNQDIAPPKETRAVITLADGRKVYLDSANNGTIAQENNVNVVKNANGEISYQAGANGEQRTANSLVYNTLTNPRGSKVIDMTLSDGSHVWLNSGSSIKYPVAFIGKERVVEITGEAYFEVKHNAQQPFKVHLPNGSVVEDIGTSFNINSYSDESDIKTTLIEGSVKVMSPAGGGDLKNSPNNKRPGVDDGIILKPGQQSVQIPNISVIRVQNNIDLEEVMAWKNGRFYFDGSDIKTIMKQVERWYDVEVIYQDPIQYSFVAKISRDVPVSNLLKLLELTNGVHFKIEGKRITVMK